MALSTLSGFRKGLFDFAFFVFDVFARNGVIFFDDHLFGHGARVLFGHIEVAGACGGVQADFDRGWLRHRLSPVSRGLPHA